MRLIFFLLGLSLSMVSLEAQRLGDKAQNLISLDNPIVQQVLAKAVETYLPKVRKGKTERVERVELRRRKEGKDWIDFQANVLFKNPQAALGNGNYRIKFKMSRTLLPPKIHYLKMQTFRIWFIRFYRRVI